MSEISNANRSTTYLHELSVILNGAKAGNSQAEATVHREFVDKLVRVASVRIGNRFRVKVSPEEVVQSVFATFFRRHRDDQFEFENWNDLWALLLKITVHKCSHRIEGFQTQKRDVDRELKNGSELEPTTILPTTGPTAEEVAIFEETLDQLFERLSDTQQQIVGLRLQGMSNLEISQKIGRTERTVYRMLNQIKQHFQEIAPTISSDS